MRIRETLGVVVLRVGVAAMMLSHGWPKLLMLLKGQGAEWMDPLGLGGTLSLTLCVFAEFVCSIALLVGCFSRLAALVLALNFWVIVFVYGEQSSWAQNELPMLYLLCFVTLVFTGAGPLSVDRFMMQRVRAPRAERERRVSAMPRGERRDPS